MEDIDVSKFWEEVDSSLDEYNAEELQRRRDERWHNCMKAVIVKELEDGGRVFVNWRCRDPRCDYCNEYKGNQLKQRIQGLIDDGISVYFLLFPCAHSSKLCRRLGGKDAYLRIPINEDTDIIFFVAENNSRKLEKLTDLDILEFDWTDLARRKTQRIISGNLGQEKIPTEDELGEYDIELMDFVAYPGETVEKAHIQTYAHDVFAWHQPETLEESKEYHQRFNAMFIKNVIDMGGKLIDIHYKVKKCKSFSVNFIYTEKFDALK